MNYFAHGRHFTDDPYLLAGTAVPDWLSVVDRKLRVRERLAKLWIDDADPAVAALARGVVQHHRDDAWFHETAAFSDLSLRFTVWIRDRFAPDDSMRPSFLGHILVELLLDATLTQREPGKLEAYYQAFERLDPKRVGEIVGRMTGQACDSLGHFVGRFVEVRFLWDYLDDGKLWFRLNQVLSRVGLAPLGEQFCELLPEARALVQARAVELLTPAE